jgi:hypothetical protein
MAVEVLFQDDVLQLGGVDDFFIERWTSPGTLDRQRRLVDVHARFIRSRAPRKTLYLVYVLSNVLQRPDAAMRAVVDEHIATIDGKVAATAVVFAGDGFSVAVLRGLMSAATMLRRSKEPHRTFAKADEALAWLAASWPTVDQEHPSPAAAYAAFERALSRGAQR